MKAAVIYQKGGGPQYTDFPDPVPQSGDELLMTLRAAALRSTDLQLSGSGLGSWMRNEVQQLFGEILPEMFGLAAEGKILVDTVSVPLKDIESLWAMDVPDGKRPVVVI